MYHLGKRIHKHTKLWHRVAWLFLFVVSVSGVYWLLNLQITPVQSVRNSPPVNKTYASNEQKKIAFDKPLLKLEFPLGWKEDTIPPSISAPKYGFHSESSQSQHMEIYIDNPPANMALNKALVVDASGSGVVHESVSDNCATYTEASKTDQRTGFAPAKWQGIDFFCDMANSSRAVVGTVSKDGFNYFNVTGAAGVPRKVFITFTDNNITPNYSVFYDVLTSLQFK